ncbi:hypothetical protein COU20_04000 [Candidatus Kaiserbacteria bacterium CG10_big_fil_rev_8_21_14_0_10_59_10]|uniref:Uncharacterized protein n=1 Tax=Candidatus Kaiserbacteria bacterium CG10_big_fil_rev_8_21_14_0_10_59_10 TaxID=1974612 RepID=A0A2H0U6R2_9BACT|nr:MAG: hypothetical protein COU20_04000 [Candidatus Kaiserbacteria bacterium CG10_big_fil_rev_8_21_14_0_10_59_10]
MWKHWSNMNKARLAEAGRGIIQRNVRAFGSDSVGFCISIECRKGITFTPPSTFGAPERRRRNMWTEQKSVQK